MNQSSFLAVNPARPALFGLENKLAEVEKWETWAQAMEEQLRESQSLGARLDEGLRHVQGGMAEAVKLLQSFQAQQSQFHGHVVPPYSFESI